MKKKSLKIISYLSVGIVAIFATNFYFKTPVSNTTNKQPYPMSIDDYLQQYYDNQPDLFSDNFLRTREGSNHTSFNKNLYFEGDLTSDHTFKDPMHYFYFLYSLSSKVYKDNDHYNNMHHCVLGTLSGKNCNFFPRTRFVSLGYFNEQFFYLTASQGEKFENLDTSSNASLLFYWDAINVQIRFQGHATYQITTQEKLILDEFRDRNNQLESRRRFYSAPVEYFSSKEEAAKNAKAPSDERVNKYLVKFEPNLMIVDYFVDHQFVDVDKGQYRHSSIMYKKQGNKWVRSYHKK